MPASFTSTSFTPDRLLAGDSPQVPRKITVLSGQVLARGAVLGKITASGKYILSLSAAVDGSQTPDLILADAVDATGGDKQAVAWATGEFNEFALVIGTAHTADSIREGLRIKGIHLIPVTGA